MAAWGGILALCARVAHILHPSSAIIYVQHTKIKPVDELRSGCLTNKPACMRYKKAFLSENFVFYLNNFNHYNTQTKNHFVQNSAIVKMIVE